MRLRLFLSYLLVIALSLIGVSLFVRHSAQDEVKTFLGRGGMIGAETLVEDLELWYGAKGSWDGVEALMLRTAGPGFGQEAGAHTGGYRRLATLRLADENGRVIYDPNKPGSIGQMEADLTYGIPLAVNENTVGYLLPQEGEKHENAQFEERIMERINHASLIAASISGAAAVILAVLLAYILLKPVKALVNATEKLADGDLSHRVAIKKPEELARLGDTFNQMAQSLEEASKRREQLTADIAHELRTPLAVQRAHLEALMDGVFPMTEENIATVLEQNQLLQRLVEDLRTITLANSGELILELQPHDLHTLVNSAVAHFTAAAREKQVEITLSLGSSHTILADAERVQQILHNLLQNGIRYTPAGGKVTLELSSDKRNAILTVHDTGPGIPEEALPYIFDRFYKAERSRSRYDSGSGLGLAIARNLAEAHRGSLTAANHALGGAIFKLTLPKYQP